eukprot:CAMPEP_0169188974 /NCGR_PEP_ID=MMETSP1016-20121227/3747_1 /TAXON_ID=342587 /ORGANISM="Karlodinium micrum, Strain CCMP2283" /LENGTH=79 /DNA_ID=CAMNT_0009265043 /DNA_START=165 /DNA_END=404 /DNA_ORIENTATION=-
MNIGGSSISADATACVFPPESGDATFAITKLCRDSVALSVGFDTMASVFKAGSRASVGKPCIHTAYVSSSALTVLRPDT